MDGCMSVLGSVGSFTNFRPELSATHHGTIGRVLEYIYVIYLPAARITSCFSCVKLARQATRTDCSPAADLWSFTVRPSHT